ncbi:potassium channel family protein [Enterobacter sp. ENT03]|uniref:potassium channel family protein n=1 Tax=Enterobacter sp. ENT03 TaxID=2854780 RepID=UPI001C47D9E6|nr:potassium channel family protein [Enterobacter sp. ENT03]MBV7405996.1 two pore domain potassium channel family protein [Enterobacter sp. ENT03]
MFISWVIKTCQHHLRRLTWPALSLLFVGHYMLCYLLFRLLGEATLVGQLSTFIYYCSVVGSTLGFGDLTPQTPGGRLFTALWQIPVGVGLFGAAMGKTIALVQGFLHKGMMGMGSYHYLRDHVVIVGWRGQQTEKIISLLLYDARQTFSRVLLCVQEEIEHPLPGNEQVDFIKIRSFSDPAEHQRMGLAHCQSVMIYPPTDEQTLSVALSVVNAVPANSHIVAWLENDDYAALLASHCPDIEIVRSLSAEQLSRSLQDPGSSQSVSSIMNPMLGDTGYVLRVPQDIKPVSYGELFSYMKYHHDATVMGISSCKNGRGMELNPVIATPVNGGLWLHLIGNQRIHAKDVAWHEIGKIV